LIIKILFILCNNFAAKLIINYNAFKKSSTTMRYEKGFFSIPTLVFKFYKAKKIE